MAKKLKAAAVMFLVIIIGLLVYAVFFGPLFAFSPFKPGFAEIKLGRCSLIFPRGTEVDPAYRQLDDLMAETERFHQLAFKKPVRVVICKSNRQHRRFSMSSGHACTIQTGTVIYVRPSIKTTAYPPVVEARGGQVELKAPLKPGPRGIAEFMKHELSHAVLYQNTSQWKALKIKRWLEEGLAVYYANSSHYFSGDDFRALVRQGWSFTLLDEESEPAGVPPDVKHTFTYGAFSEFIKYLGDKHGLDKVLAYVHAYIQAPGKEAELFQQTFGVSQQAAVDAFWKSLKE